MSNEELTLLFTGFGYQVAIVEGPDLDASMYAALDWALENIKVIQTAARSGKPLNKPRFPMIVLRSPKGMGGIKEINGLKIEGSYRSHQVPTKLCKTAKEQLQMVNDWLHSYHPEQLFDEKGRLKESLRRLLPTGSKRMGDNYYANGRRLTTLKCPPMTKDRPYMVNLHTTVDGGRGQTQESSMVLLGKYLAQIIQDNPNNFRIFSPDELESNLLTGAFEKTHRNFQWGYEDDRIKKNQGGRIIEILSEHTIQGWLQGYILTGRYGLFPSYEAFLGIIATMMDQFAKFLKMSIEIPWRNNIPSMNFIETSTLWRQEHNGFSHQNPGFINTLLNKKSVMLRIYLPPDPNTLIVTMDHCLRSVNKINLVIGSKQPMPVWLTPEEALDHCRAGAGAWEWASSYSGKDPDVVLVGVGTEATAEVVAAAYLLRTNAPECRVRVVNVADLLVLATKGKHPHGLSDEKFDALFTPDRPVIFNFHGYPSAMKQLLFGRANKLHTPTGVEKERFSIHGYEEEGTTTTPFDMLVCNSASRYHLATEALQMASIYNKNIAGDTVAVTSKFEYILRDFKEYILEYGQDPPFINDFWKDYKPSRGGSPQP